MSKQVAETWLILPVSCGHLSNYYLLCLVNPPEQSSKLRREKLRAPRGSRHSTSIMMSHQMPRSERDGGEGWEEKDKENISGVSSSKKVGDLDILVFIVEIKPNYCLQNKTKTYLTNKYNQTKHK
ncbi:hypothetical protein ILYODFUR_013263 [Ilyodon furcidens]|uniref:Uncharacterized protein n=1 Tax=Ilyodon furcidens TaxID=33524 RepID=A0ABV0SN21_9TELE